MVLQENLYHLSQSQTSRECQEQQPQFKSLLPLLLQV